MKHPVQFLFDTTYGSHLYGTQTPTSDFDYKVVVLPALTSLLLGEKLQVTKERFDAAGNPVSGDSQMPEGGVEKEYVPLQTLCRDYLAGQTYALEIVQGAGDRSPQWMVELRDKFTTSNVASMAGFAKKQTFDYVHRGARLAQAEKLRDALETLLVNKKSFEHYMPELKDKFLRLDTVLFNEKVIHTVAQSAGLKLGIAENNGKKMETLVLNGRDYLETTTIEHLLNAVRKLIDTYGHRSEAARDTLVDLKSLMHAVRVYQQACELLDTGKITFPRKNAAELLAIKKGETDLEKVKEQLAELEVTLDSKMETTSLRKATT